jgi:MOSC domain-containing protein YiiM
MQLLSVNIGQSKSIPNAKKSGKSGIFKEPTDRAVQITSEGLVNDAVIDTKHHGGVDQAVYVYGAPDYAWWSQTLGSEVHPGTFGDNLTIDGLESAELNIGDRLHFATVILEVTAPRIPCSTLAARMGDPQFVKRFRAAERPGLYCRVIQTGNVQVGEAVRLETCQGDTIGAREMFQIYYDHDAPPAAIARILAAPVAVRARHDYEERLAALNAKAEETN